MAQIKLESKPPFRLVADGAVGHLYRPSSLVRRFLRSFVHGVVIGVLLQLVYCMCIYLSCHTKAASADHNYDNSRTKMPLRVLLISPAPAVTLLRECWVRRVHTVFACQQMLWLGPQALF
mmetsp:Transcript_27027/g.81814  ORF Transcript_27027/g.81814 Transcript_27027/m.81814 type:complete len:120 (-) Transcript_27027:43-402(-)|eukprot:scaffold17955_cov31-Tisochrysis_lutea.AAC.3